MQYHQECSLALHLPKPAAQKAGKPVAHSIISKVSAARHLWLKLGSKQVIQSKLHGVIIPQECF